MKQQHIDLIVYAAIAAAIWYFTRPKLATSWQVPMPQASITPWPTTFTPMVTNTVPYPHVARS